MRKYTIVVTVTFALIFIAYMIFAIGSLLGYNKTSLIIEGRVIQDNMVGSVQVNNWDYLFLYLPAGIFCLALVFFLTSSLVFLIKRLFSSS